MDEPMTPEPSEQLDSQLIRVIRAYRMTQKLAHWFLAFVAAVSLVSLVISLTTSQNQTSTAQHTVANVVSAQCAFYQDIGTAPVTKVVTEIGAKILVDSRNAYIGLGACAGQLPPPSPALVQAAIKYHLKLKG